MRIRLISGSGCGCGALPAVVAAMRRRGWSVTPVLPPTADACPGADLLCQVCGQAAADLQCLPAADVVVVAPGSAAALAWAVTSGTAGDPGLPRLPLVVVPVCPGALGPAGSAPTGLPGAARLVPASLPLLGGFADLSMAGPEAICESVAATLSPQDLGGVAVLVSAGPTAEDLDPVRFLTNRSSGRMGLALGLAAWRRGAALTLVHGPWQVEAPVLPGLELVPVRSAREMHQAVLARSADLRVAILCAAVADFTPTRREEGKIKKAGRDGYCLELTRTPDILAALGALPSRPFLVGFAAETHDVLTQAADKLRRKNCDLLCANDLTEPGSGFAVATNRLTLLARDGSVNALPLLTKAEAAERIIDRVVAGLRSGAGLNP